MTGPHIWNGERPEWLPVDVTHWFLCHWKRDVGGVCSQRGAGGSRGAFGERRLCVSGELHQTGRAVPLRHYIHARSTRQEAVRRAREPGTREEWRYVRRNSVFYEFQWGGGGHTHPPEQLIMCGPFPARLDLDAVGPVSSWEAALPATGWSETTRLPAVQELRIKHWH